MQEGLHVRCAGGPPGPRRAREETPRRARNCCPSACTPSRGRCAWVRHRRLCTKAAQDAIDDAKASREWRGVHGGGAAPARLDDSPSSRRAAREARTAARARVTDGGRQQYKSRGREGQAAGGPTRTKIDPQCRDVKLSKVLGAAGAGDPRSWATTTRRGARRPSMASGSRATAAAGDAELRAAATLEPALPRCPTRRAASAAPARRRGAVADAATTADSTRTPRRAASLKPARLDDAHGVLKPRSRRGA